MNYLKKTNPPKLRVSSVSTARNILDNKTEFERSVEFINGTGKTIYIGFRDGTIAAIRPVVRIGIHNELIVRKSNIFNLDNGISTRILNSTMSVEEIALNESYRKMEQLTVTQDRVTVTDYSIPLEILERKGGTAYYADLDIVVSVNPVDSMPYHPESTAKATEECITDDINNSYTAATLSIKVVDRSGKHEAFYANIGGAVHIVPIVADTRLDEGVYVYRSRVADGDVCATPEAVRSDIEAHSPVDGTMQPYLYETYKDAITKGDPFKYREMDNEAILADIKNRELEVKARKVELDMLIEEEKSKNVLEADALKRERIEFEDKMAREKLKLEKQAERMKMEQQELEHTQKVKSIMVKDEYEERSYRRKDSSEILKYAPVVLTGLMGIAALVGKVR